MHRGSALVLTVLVLWVAGVSENPLARCLCMNLALCQPMTQSNLAKLDMEVIVHDTGGTDWKHYMWSKITTIITSGNHDPELLCHAHASSVRVLLRGTLPPIRTLNSRLKRKRWIKKNVQLVKNKFMDGFNLHLDQTAARYSAKSRKITQVVREVYQTFHKAMPWSKVIVNVPWSPGCIYGRCYEYTKFSEYSDSLFVMGYNMHTPTKHDCYAKPNSPYDNISSGIRAYIALGIIPSKLILGVPWFGIDYTCKHFHEAGGCELFNEPGKDTCSFKSGRKIPYKKIMKLLPKSTSMKFWEHDLQVPSFTYKSNGRHHEVWYDDPKSIALKLALVKEFKLHGIGVWNGNFLNYSSDSLATKQTERMWSALDYSCGRC